ncbi:MAG: flap endonuclease [Myxococcales bacterium]|nr:flap endonuclease [Myxococcales bacterium]
MKLHLIDGTYELFRQFFGRPGVTGPDGMEVGAVQGMLRTMLSLVTTEGATHVGVAFDEVIESFRNDLFAGYKTGAGLDPVLWDQHPLAIEASFAMGFVTWPMVRYETDDALASAAHQLAAGFDQVLIGSPDKDFAQCVVSDRVVLLDRRRELVLDEPAVVEKWGVPPAAIPDWLALVGDSADGIPGIPKWGAKSAATALARYGSIEAIPDDASAWDVKIRGAASLAASLAGMREEAALYKVLATLVTDVELGVDGPDAMVWRGADRPRLEALCARIGFERFVERVPRFR